MPMKFKIKLITYIILLGVSCQKNTQPSSPSVATGDLVKDAVKAKLCAQSLDRLQGFVYQSFSLYLDPKNTEDDLIDELYNMATDSSIVPKLDGFDDVLKSYKHFTVTSKDWKYFLFDKDKIRTPVDLRVYFKPKSVESWSQVTQRLFADQNFLKSFTVGKHIDLSMSEPSKFQRRDYICLSFDTTKSNIFELLTVINQSTAGHVIAEDAPLGLSLNKGTYIVPVLSDISTTSPTEAILFGMLDAFKHQAPVKNPCLGLDQRLAVTRSVTKTISEKFLTMPFCKL
jgi:hypothetical protein